MSRIGYSPINFGIFESVKSSSSNSNAKGTGTLAIERFPQIAYTYDLKKLQLVPAKDAFRPSAESFYEINFQFPQLQQPQPLRVIVGRQDGTLTAVLAGNGALFRSPDAQVWNQMGERRSYDFLPASFFQNTHFAQPPLVDLYKAFETGLQEEAKAIFTRAEQEWCRKK